MQKRLLEFVQNATAFDPAETLLPLNVGMVRVGWLKSSFAEQLNNWPELFSVRPRGVGIIGEFDSADHRSAALGEVIEALATAGYIKGWRNEQISVAESFYAEPQFHIERAATRPLGITVYGSHLNGLTVKNSQPQVWLARRAASKEIDPGLLDNLAAGRIARGYGPFDTLVKEAGEEAGIAEAAAKTAKCAGATRTCHETAEGLHAEIVFTYDLILPDSFTPQNQDGEVAEFICMPIGEVITLLDSDPAQFTTDAVLVMVDCLIRRGYLAPARDDYLELIHAMRP
jgi:isopentenyldiphosphate isomerase